MEIFSKIWVNLTRLSSFSEVWKFRIFYLALASSFGRDNSKDDGDAHSRKETL